MSSKAALFVYNCNHSQSTCSPVQDSLSVYPQSHSIHILSKGSIIFTTWGEGSWNLGEHMNFGNQKWEQNNFGTLRGKQKNLTDPIEKKILRSKY